VSWKQPAVAYQLHVTFRILWHSISCLFRQQRAIRGDECGAPSQLYNERKPTKRIQKSVFSIKMEPNHQESTTIASDDLFSTFLVPDVLSIIYSHLDIFLLGRHAHKYCNLAIESAPYRLPGFISVTHQLSNGGPFSLQRRFQF
jgi:hypothetical protein